MMPPSSAVCVAVLPGVLSSGRINPCACGQTTLLFAKAASSFLRSLV